MPFYTYLCNDCYEINNFNLSIQSFLTSKDSLECNKCNSKNLVRNIKPINSCIEKSTAEIKEEIKNDVNLISKKIKDGDQKTIECIYGKK